MQRADDDRRGFLARSARGGLRVGLAGGAVGVLAAFLRRGALPRPVEVREPGILRPPGALAEDEFLSTCTRCSLCAQACETSCILLFGPAEGHHFGTPYIAAAQRACNLCLACTRACPSGALAVLADRTDAAMGTAVVDERLCVSWNGTGACGACHTVCPLRNRAITQGIRNQPTVHAEHCAGCGLCEEACIVRDRRAIRVFSGRSWS